MARLVYQSGFLRIPVLPQYPDRFLQMIRYQKFKALSHLLLALVLLLVYRVYGALRVHEFCFPEYSTQHSVSWNASVL